MDLGEKGVWYRYQVGGFTNEAKAKDLKERLNDLGNGGAVVVRPKDEHR